MPDSQSRHSETLLGINYVLVLQFIHPCMSGCLQSVFFSIKGLFQDITFKSVLLAVEEWNDPTCVSVSLYAAPITHRAWQNILAK